MRRFASSWHQTADLTHHTHHTEITLQDVPNREYTLKLFGDNEERELQKIGNQSWTPAQRQYALYSFRYIHALKVVRVQRYVCDSRDARRDPNEQSLPLGEEPTERQCHRHSKANQGLLGLHRARFHGIRSVSTTN